jgi:hypothetical protein
MGEALQRWIMLPRSKLGARENLQAKSPAGPVRRLGKEIKPDKENLQ